MRNKAVGYTHVVSFTQVNESYMDMNKKQLTSLSGFSSRSTPESTILQRSFAPNLLPAPLSTALITLVPLALRLCAWLAQLSSQGFAGFRSHHPGCEQYL